MASCFVFCFFLTVEIYIHDQLLKIYILGLTVTDRLEILERLNKNMIGCGLYM